MNGISQESQRVQELVDGSSFDLLDRRGLRTDGGDGDDGEDSGGSHLGFGWKRLRLKKLRMEEVERLRGRGGGWKNQRR